MLEKRQERNTHTHTKPHSYNMEDVLHRFVLLDAVVVVSVVEPVCCVCASESVG